MEKLFVNIRKAEPADIGGIASIYEQAVLLGTASFEVTPPSEEEMLSRMQTIEAGHYPYLVAELEHQILGFAYAGQYRPRKAYRYTVEDSIYVHPECRRLGVGTQLLTSLIAECDLRGFREIIKLHEHCGFRHVGVLKNVGYKFDRWLDSVLMQRTLAGGDTMNC